MKLVHFLIAALLPAVLTWAFIRYSCLNIDVLRKHLLGRSGAVGMVVVGRWLARTFIALTIVTFGVLFSKTTCSERPELFLSYVPPTLVVASAFYFIINDPRDSTIDDISRSSFASLLVMLLLFAAVNCYIL